MFFYKPGITLPHTSIPIEIGSHGNPQIRFLFFPMAGHLRLVFTSPTDDAAPTSSFAALPSTESSGARAPPPVPQLCAPTAVVEAGGTGGGRARCARGGRVRGRAGGQTASAGFRDGESGAMAKVASEHRGMPNEIASRRRWRGCWNLLLPSLNNCRFRFPRNDFD